ncbi:MAG: glycoside hydrolase family 99-like domain-containing protein [Chlorobium sp.]|nr:glycoside hydrolase family 99-like domain-containing protein [Chlorobium sp.]
MSDRDSQIGSLNQAVSDRDSQVVSLNQAVSERDAQIGSLNQAVSERDGQIVSLNQAVTERDGQIGSLNQAVTERDGQIGSLNQAVTERDGQIASLNQAVTERDEFINEVLRSRSWLFTKPFRSLRRNLLSRPGAVIRKSLSDKARHVWRKLPLTIPIKQKLKHSAFSNLPILFKHTQAYQSWVSFQLPVEGKLCSTYYSYSTGQTVDPYVPIIEALPLEHQGVKLICFYLPQFHAIPENNEWWGDGFTEWVNVQPAQPQFEGHYQPHVPGELGYYNLLDPAVQHRQVELAKLYGVGGFCFYFYWFGGKRLLEAPTENYLNDNTLDLPFCLCWANENWSRRWDGLDSEILIEQQHSADDDFAFIQHVARFMRDSRYIRINGKPLLLVYRPSLLPSAKETATRWREWCLVNGIGEIFLAYTQSFEMADPAVYGFDAAIEFPPNNSAPPDITNSVVPLEKDFRGIVYDWRVFVERSEHYKKMAYTLFRSVCPSWDNTARRKNCGTVFLNSAPELYQRWLENAISDTVKNNSPDEHLVFINAWNEWAEGAHLEPDSRYGYAWLQATRDALLKTAGEEKRRMVIVTHDAHPHGAQYLALNMARELREGMGYELAIVCLGEGMLRDQFCHYGSVHDLSGQSAYGEVARTLAHNLFKAGYHSALVNTTVSGEFLAVLAEAGMQCVAMVHEMAGVLQQRGLQAHMKSIARHAQKVVFASEVVQRDFTELVPLSEEQICIRAQGVYKRNRLVGEARSATRISVRRELGVSETAKIVLGVGYADHRKGVDLFVEAALHAVVQDELLHFVWAGHWDAGMQQQVERMLCSVGDALRAHLHFPGRQDDTDTWYAAADLFVLSSREDPYPSVVMEAMESGLVVVAFADGHGTAELIVESGGLLIDRQDGALLAAGVLQMLGDQAGRVFAGERGAALVREHFSFRHYLFDLLEWAGHPLQRVSVVLPNYNYARYLPERFASIEAQDLPIYEVIVLDDASTDDSLDVIRQLVAGSRLDVRCDFNTENSGSVFAQWQKGASLATGDFVWIAEADDLAEPLFLREVLRSLKHEQIVLGYCESCQIDADGRVLANNYHDYIRHLGVEKWQHSYRNRGLDEIRHFLAIQNTIPNVSAVVFRRKALFEMLEQHGSTIQRYQVAGDWMTYLHLLAKGDISFVAQTLNRHRRHDSGVTIGLSAHILLKEIREIQDWVAVTFSCDPLVLSRAKSYFDQLKVQFDITED